MKKTLVVILSLMLPLVWVWAAGENAEPEEQIEEMLKAGINPVDEGLALNPVKGGNLLDSSAPIPDPPVIAVNLVTQTFEEDWDCATPPTGWTIIDNGTEGSQCWFNQDWYKYYYSSWSDTTARFYYSPAMESTYNEWLISPSVILPSAATACSLTFNNYYNDDGAGKDTAYVKISTDGAHWTNLVVWDEDHGGTTPGAENIDITSYAGDTVQVAFVLECNTGLYGDAYWWYLDKVNVWADASSLLFEDFNNWGPGGNLPPSGWTILDNGIPYPGQDTCNVNDYYRYSAWGSNVARVYYTSTYREWQDEWLISPSFSISSGVECTLTVSEYYYHSTSAAPWGLEDHGYIKITTDGGTNWDIIYDNDVTKGSSSTENVYQYDLTAYTGQTCQVAFNFVNSPYGYDYWYIDNVSVDEYVPPSEDATVTSIDAPPLMAYTNGNYTITATIENLMADSTIIDSVLFEVDTAGTVVFSNMTYPGVYIQGYASQQFSSSIPWIPTFEYWYVVTVTLYGSGDGFAGNNSRAETKIIQDVRAYPYLEDMEYATVGDLPLVIFTFSGTSAGVYWSTSYSHSPTHCTYFSYSPYPREVAIVFPPVTLTSATMPMLEFYEATYLTYWGNDLDQVHTVGIISSDFDLNNIDTLWTYGPDTHTPWDRGDWANGPAKNLDMSAYVGDTVRVVMHYNEPANPTYGSYWYLDDVALKETPVGDVGPTDFVSGTVGMVGQPYSPVVEVTNYGGDTPDVPVKLVIDSAGAPIYTDWDTITAIPAFGTANASFADFTPVAGGLYAMTATTELVVEDNDPSNDTLTANLAVFSSVEDFEATNGTLAGSGDWEWGTPTNPEGPDSAYSGVNLWATNLAGDYTAGLHTLEFTLALGLGNAGLGMASWYDTEASYDGGNFSISTDGGGTWIVISPDIGYSGTANSSNPIPTGDSIFTGHNQGFWETPFFDLSAYAGDTVAARLTFGADGSVFYPGWHVDDFAFLNCAIYVPSIDAALVSIDSPDDMVFTGSTVTPQVTVGNNGDAATTVDVTFRILDNTQAVVYNQTETTGLVPGGGTLQHTFTTTWSASPEGTYDLIANVTLAGDGNPANDTVTTSLDVVTHYSTGGPDDFGYRWIDNVTIADEDPPVFAYIDLSADPLADTAGSGTGTYGRFPIGFDFSFYGTTYSTVIIHAYGYVAFDSTAYLTANDCPIPSTTTPDDPMVMVFWDYPYCNPTYDGACIYRTFGTEPDRYMVIQYHNYRRSSYNMEFELILHENGDIVYQYLDVDEAGAYGQGQSATVGIQSANVGTRMGLSYLCGTATVPDWPGNLLTDSLAIKWYVPVFAHDIVADEFIQPATGSGVVGVPFTPEVLFTNNGTSDETNVRVRVIIDPGGYNNDQMIAVLDSGTSYAQTFAQFTPTTGGIYTLTAISELPGDEDPASDTLVMYYTAYDAVYDFEADNGGLSATNDWEWGVPSNVGPATAHSGTKCWATIIDGNRTSGYYAPGGFIYSDLSFQLDLGMDNDATMGFYQWYQTSGVGYDSLNVIINAGAGDILLSTTYGTTPDWEEAVYDLSAYTGNVDVKLQYFSRSSVDNPGWYIDDLALASCQIVTPDIDVTPLAVSGQADPGFSDADTLTISNTGDGTLNYAVTVYQDPIVTRFDGTVEPLYEVGDGSRPDRTPMGYLPISDKLMDENMSAGEIQQGEPLYPPQIDAYGGPDAYGYTWIDSDEPTGPTYGWIDISTSGTEITTWNGSVDDGYSNPIAMNMSFNFYGTNYDTVVVSTNGWVSFSPQTSSYLSNATIPSTAAPNNILAVLWDDQDGGTVGHCYYYYDMFENQFIVSWVGWPWYPDPTDPHDFQVILDGDEGTILYQYGTGVYQTDVTIGIENVDGTMGLEVVYNAAYAEDSLAVLIVPPTFWLFSDVASGTIAPSGPSDPVEITMDALDLTAGIYTGRVEIASNDPDEGVVDVPVTFVVGGLGTVAGQVTDANTAGTLEGAIVTATLVTATTVVDTTDEGGNYSIDITPGTVNVTVEMPGYQTDSQDVVVVEDQTTTHNVALGAPLATIDISPVIDTLIVGDTAVYSRYLYNTGTAPLTYSVVLDFDVEAPLSIRSNIVSERVANVVDPAGIADIAPFSYSGGNLPAILDYQDSVFVFDCEVPSGDNGCLGVEFDGEFFWVTGRNASGGDIHKLHKFDRNGFLLVSYDQGTTTTWGWRDLAWDGQYLYASDENELAIIDPATGTKIGTLPMPTGLSPVRALAWDPATDHFWSANFSSDIYEFDRTGFIHNQYSNTHSAYGMAWDDLTEGGPYLWVHSQNGTPLLEIAQFDPSTGTYTGEAWQGSLPTGYTDAMAGGACFTTEWDPTIGVLFTLAQGTPTDFVYGYEIATNITWITIQSGGSGEVAVDDSALIEFLVDFRDSTIVIDSTYQADANINNNSMAPTPEIHFAITAAAAGCPYVVGDVNGSDSYNGLDITYGVNFFKGGSDPMCPECPIPLCNTWNYCGDVNGSCTYNGLDITYGVAYFKGGPDPIFCPDCPPADGDAVTFQGKELKPAVQPAVESKSKSKKGNSLNK